MALAPKTKTPAPKTAAPKGKTKEPKAKTKAAKAPKEPRGPTRNGRAVELLLTRKHTDQEIKDIVNKEFAPLTINNAAIPVARANLNKALSAKEKIEPLFRNEAGKLVAKSELPPKEKPAKRPKVDPAKDPLRKVAGINPKAKPAKVAKTPKAA